jgi:hypothetical protein
MKPFEKYQQQGLIEPIRIGLPKWLAFFANFFRFFLILLNYAVIFVLFLIFFYIILLFIKGMTGDINGERFFKMGALPIYSDIGWAAVILSIISLLLFMLLVFFRGKKFTSIPLSSRIERWIFRQSYNVILDDQGLFTMKYKLKIAWEDINKFSITEMGQKPFSSTLFLKVDNYENYLKEMSPLTRFWQKFYNTRIGRNIFRLIILLSAYRDSILIQQVIIGTFFKKWKNSTFI